MNLRPYGRVIPKRFDRRNLKAWLLGIRDGWEQPRELSTSLNVEHLDDGEGWVYDSHDAGINLGQWIRSPFHHQQQED